MPLLILLLLVIFLYSWFLEPAWLEIRSERIEVSPAMLKKPLRLLFLTDIHGSSLASARVARRQLAVLAARHHDRPFDAVLLGGDYVDTDPRYLSQAEEYVTAALSWKVPVYAVFGNHDYRSTGGDVAAMRSRLESLGVTVLVNESAVLSAHGQKLEIIGLDDLEHSTEYRGNFEKLQPAEYRRRASALGWYKKFDDSHPDLPRLVLAHNPDSVHLPGHRRPDVVVAGHTHGGQYALWDRLNAYNKTFLVPRGSFGTWSGRRLVDGRTLVVSRGIGGSLLPARFLRRPEAVEIILEPATYRRSVVVGISGKPRSGKDTVAAMVEAILPGITRSDFSHIMREEFDAEFGTNIRHDDHEKERLRAQMSEFVNSKRAIDPDYWIKKVFVHEPPLLVTPIRYEGEIKALWEAGGKIIKVEAGHQHLRKRIRQDFAEQIKMVNEIQLDHFTDWDYVITNDGTLEDLEKKVREVIADILEKN